MGFFPDRVPWITNEELGVSAAFPGVAPNPLLSRAARRRNAELSSGALAIGTVVGWRELNDNPRVLFILDVDTPDSGSFWGIADEDSSITEVSRLAVGQKFAVRHRPAVNDHYVALARDVDLARIQELDAQIRRARGQ